MQLITNNPKHNHLELINELIEKSKKMFLCTAWINKEGISKILPSLEKTILNNNAQIEILSNKKHTNEQIVQLLTNDNITHHIVGKKYLHTKIYLFEYGRYFTALIGSMNLTKGALITNEELSIKIEGKIKSKKYKQVVEYIKELKKLI
jgi:HKD family nuclease